MKHEFPPLVDPETLPRRVLVVAPHPDDEVLGCGGTLAFHAQRGDEVRVLVLTTPADGPRAGESRAAAARLGIPEPRFLGGVDGALEGQGDLAERVGAELAELEPELVYAPCTTESHPDHRAAARAVLAALAARGSARPDAAAPRLLCYAINDPVPCGVLIDVSPWHERKLAALACFESQLERHDLVDCARAADRARSVNVDDRGVVAVEGFVDPSDARLDAVIERLRELRRGPATDEHATTAVISTWNKRDDLRENLDALLAQERPFASIVVVDNASSDGTAAMVAAEFPSVRLVRMPHSAYGACETFNIGFASATTPLVAILDDDVVLPPDWLSKTTARLAAEPATTAIVSTKIVEPEMPASYSESAAVNTERYMSTFRGCASLARRDALAGAGFYDERLFIYGNERDLTCRLLNRGHRVLQYPDAQAFHKTPFGMKMGKRSLFYHARNAWLAMLKYAPLGDLLKLPFLVVAKVLLRGGRKEAEGGVTDATGTIGLVRSLRETPGAWWVLVRAGWSVVCNVPYCLRHREPCRHPDFELPIR